MSIPANPDPRVITVWSDVGSPAGAFALLSLRAAAEERGVRLLIDHRACPTELLDGRPLSKHLVDTQMRAALACRPDLGWQPWQDSDAHYPVTTLLASEAVQAAKLPAHGGLIGSDALDGALRHAFLVDSRCISLYSVVTDVVRSCPLVDAVGVIDAIDAGMGRAKVMAQRDVMVHRGFGAGPYVLTARGFVPMKPRLPGEWEPDGAWAGRLIDTM